jgi:membrane protein implicated in regulation of membrane protease activity
MAWWFWTLLGFLLFAGEMFLPLDFFLFFFGLAFLTTGIISWMGIIADTAWQFTFCGVSSILFVVVLRPYLKGKLSSNTKPVSELKGDKVIISEDITPGATGKGSMRGTTWQVKNNTNEMLMANSSYVVSATESLTLIIE